MFFSQVSDQDDNDRKLVLFREIKDMIRITGLSLLLTFYSQLGLAESYGEKTGKCFQEKLSPIYGMETKKSIVVADEELDAYWVKVAVRGDETLAVNANGDIYYYNSNGVPRKIIRDKFKGRVRYVDIASDGTIALIASGDEELYVIDQEGKIIGPAKPSDLITKAYRKSLKGLYGDIAETESRASVKSTLGAPRIVGTPLR